MCEREARRVFSGWESYEFHWNRMSAVVAGRKVLCCAINWLINDDRVDMCVCQCFYWLNFNNLNILGVVFLDWCWFSLQLNILWICSIVSYLNRPTFKYFSNRILSAYSLGLVLQIKNSPLRDFAYYRQTKCIKKITLFPAHRTHLHKITWQVNKIHRVQWRISPSTKLNNNNKMRNVLGAQYNPWTRRGLWDESDQQPIWMQTCQFGLAPTFSLYWYFIIFIQ